MLKNILKEVIDPQLYDLNFKHNSSLQVLYLNPLGNFDFHIDIVKPLGNFDYILM